MKTSDIAGHGHGPEPGGHPERQDEQVQAIHKTSPHASQAFPCNGMLGAGAVTGSWNHPIHGCEIDAKAQNLASASACEPRSLRSFLATRGSSGKSWTLWMDIVRTYQQCMSTANEKLLQMSSSMGIGCGKSLRMESRSGVKTILVFVFGVFMTLRHSTQSHGPTPCVDVTKVKDFTSKRAY